MPVQKTEKEGDKKTSEEHVTFKEGFDFTAFSDRALKDLVTHQMYGSYAKKLLENRGYYVRIKDGEVRMRKKPS